VIRAAIVVVRTRNARAISSVDSPAHHLQGEGHAGIDRQHRVTRGEHQPEHVVSDVGVELDLVHRSLVITQLATDQLDLALKCHGATNRVDAAAACHGHEPGARVVRDT
jgi:hypothetical protein